MQVTVQQEFFPDQRGEEKIDLSSHFYRAFEKCAAEIRNSNNQTEDEIFKRARAWGLIRRSGEICYDQKTLLQQLAVYVRTSDDDCLAVACRCYERLFSVYERRDRESLVAFFQQGRRSG
jgi:hypothetical protein